MDLDQILRTQLGIAAGDLRGARLTAEIAVPDALLNALIAARLAGASLPVASIHVESTGNGMLAVVVPRIRAIPALRLTLAVERQAVFPDDPVLYLRWELPRFGALAGAVPLLARALTLPPWMAVDGARVMVDIPALLRWRGLGDLARYLRRLDVRVEPGSVVVRMEAGA